jgi:D-arabinose 1-dehydrogenase-like Zn-dependent alcohol dehydrogenase
MTSSLADYLTAVLNWWSAHPVQGLAGLGLLAVAIIAAAVALTIVDNRRRDDELLDRVGAATTSASADTGDELSEALLRWRDEVEHSPIPDLVDVDTALATIKAGAL